MTYLEAVHDRLREEYEEYREKQNKRMEVVEFQLQLKTTKFTAREVLQQIDPSAPIPHAIDSGNGESSLYHCVLREKNIDALQAFCASNQTDVTITSDYRVVLLAKELYTSDSTVRSS